MVAGAMALAVAGGAPRRARADGAFPDAQRVLLAGGRAQQIVLATNFGLLLSYDGGRSWLWSCEQDANAFGALYQYGATPRDRIFAVANQQLVFSDDDSCTWRTAGGRAAGAAITDAFADPHDADRVVAIAYDGAARVFAVLESSDGGTTFDRALYSADPGVTLTGLEIAASDPLTLYLTMSVGSPPSPALARSTDGGQRWPITDLSGPLGPGALRLVAVDPRDPDRALLLWSSASGQALVLATGGGAGVTRPLVTAAGAFTSYTRTETGAILIGGVDGDARPILYRSRDGAATFDAVAGAPHVRGLAAGAAGVFAATDNFADGYALALSQDDGATWRGVMSYDRVQAILPCVKARCHDGCEAQAALGLWSSSVCSADPAPMTMTDAGSGGNDGRNGSDASEPTPADASADETTGETTGETAGEGQGTGGEGQGTGGEAAGGGGTGGGAPGDSRNGNGDGDSDLGAERERGADELGGASAAGCACATCATTRGSAWLAALLAAAFCLRRRRRQHLDANKTCARTADCRTFDGQAKPC